MVPGLNSQKDALDFWVVGLGRVGSLVARLAAENGRLRGITVREDADEVRAKTFGEGVCVSRGPVDDLDENCIVLLCVPDALLLSVASSWAGKGAGGFVHFSGSLGVAAMTARVGILDVAALHPLLSISSEDMRTEEAHGVTFGLSGEGRARQAAELLARWFGGEVVEVDEGSRAAWHLAATIASNGVYALLSIATQIAATNGITGFDVERGLASLAAQSAKSASLYGSVEGATGPIVRGDALTVDKHLKVLEHEPDARALYIELSRALIDIAEMRGVSDRNLAAMRALLESASTPGV